MRTTIFFAVFMVLVAGMTAILSYLMSIASSRWARRFGAVDQPSGGRKIHTQPVPLFGGVGIVLTVLIAFFLLAWNGLWTFAGILPGQLVGFCVALTILLVGGAIDDRWPLPPSIQIIFPILAAFSVVVSGTGIIQVTNLSGHGAFSLTWWRFDLWHISLPADLLTVGWLLVATYATKLLDGLDGLVTGMAVIGSAMVGALTVSPMYFQPGVAMLAGTVGGAFLGFLPRNIHPAKQFLGEVGSTVAGFSLGFLAIVSSAKVAIALSVLAIPLSDAFFVVIGRLRRGVSPWKGDDTHLHFRLLRAGIPHRTVVGVLWGCFLAAGVLALTLQTRGKIFLITALVVLTALSSWVTNRRTKTYGTASTK